MKTIHIRFLKQGLLTIEVPDDSSLLDMQELGKDALDTASDQDLIMAMSEVVPSGNTPTRFDADSFQVEAIESDEYVILYETDLWKEYLK